MGKVKVKVLKEFSQGGADRSPGDTVTLRADQAEWLASVGYVETAGRARDNGKEKADES